MLGVPADLSCIARSAGYSPQAGANLAGLRRAAESLGLEACCYQLTLADARRLTTRSLSIAHVDGNHFVVLWADGSQAVRVLDPLAGESTATLKEFGRRWDGAALVLSRPGEQPRWGNPWLTWALTVAGLAVLAASAVAITRPMLRRLQSAKRVPTSLR